MQFVRRHPLLLLVGVLVIAAAFCYGRFFGPVDTRGENQTVVVLPDDTLAGVAAKLKSEGLIRSEWAFEAAYLKRSRGVGLRPGGFTLSPALDAWSTADVLANSPYLAFVKIPRGRRKEEIADRLQTTLSWNEEQKQEWLTASNAWPEAYAEGVYFPDTYLIPSDDAPRVVAETMRQRFIEAFEPLALEAGKQNIKWTTVVKMASLIEREAAGPEDMPLIAGIMWARLDRGMRLQIDASLQYIKGTEEDGWWGRVKSEDKYLESDFNTYQHEGLPPAPIANPGLDSMMAVLNPEKTSCLYYLHDNRGQIHCSPNYAGHVANIRKYLQ